MLTMLLVALADDPLIRVARAKTAAERPCVIDTTMTDITVCGRRNSDRFRVPFDTRTARRADDVTASRAALVRARKPMEEMGPFLVGGGAAGVHATTAVGPGAGSGATAFAGMRTPAP